jgi:RNA polymerase sigma-70 factor (ECF subfamily)
VALLLNAGTGRWMDDPYEPVLETFEVFYRRERRAVVGLAFVLSGSAPIAEELAQDAFIAALRDWGRVGQLEDPSGWVRRVVANRSVSRFRRLAVEARFVGRGTDRSWSPAEERDVDLWREVRRLPKRQAQVVALYYVDDLSRRDIARVLGCSEETVKTHLERARRTLAARLGEVSEEGG